MTKFLSYLSVFLLLAVYILSGLYINQKKRISELETEKSVIAGNNEFLEAEIEKRNEAALSAGERVRQIEEAAEASKNKTACFGWNDDISNDSVILALKGKK